MRQRQQKDRSSPKILWSRFRVLFQRPVVEARWNSSRQDDRGTFYASSSLAPAADNLNSLFIHNSIRDDYKTSQLLAQMISM